MNIKNTFKKGLVGLLCSLLIITNVFAQVGGGGGIQPGGLFKLSSGAILPISAGYTLGDASNRFAEIWGNVGNFTTLTVGGVAAGDLDMQGNDILNVDQISGNSAAVHIGTGSPNNAAGAGALYVQSAVESDLGFFAPDNGGIIIGNSADASLYYYTGDANANSPYITVPAGDATNSSTLVVGNQAAAMTDLGFFDGETEPGIALVKGDGSKFASLRWKGTYFTFGSDGGATQYLFEPTLNVSQMIQSSDSLFIMGSSTAGTFKRNTVFGDDDIRFNFTTHPLIFTSTGNVNNDFGKGVQTRPRVYMTSETAFTTSQDEWFSYYHDTDRSRLTSGTGSIAVGTGTPASFSSEGGSDLYVTDELEVDGIGYFDSVLKVLNGAIWSGIGRSSGIQFSGTASTRGGIIYNTDEGMSLVAGDNDGNGNHVINIISGGNVLKDHDQDTFSDDPVLNIFSRTDPDTDNQQYGYLKHNTSDFIIGTETGTTKIEGGQSSGGTTVNAATYDLSEDDYFLCVTYTTTGAVTSLTIPSAQITSGREFVVKDCGGNAGTNSITIDTEGSETIDGAATKVLSTNYESVIIKEHGGNLYIYS